MRRSQLFHRRHTPGELLLPQKGWAGNQKFSQFLQIHCWLCCPSCPPVSLPFDEWQLHQRRQELRMNPGSVWFHMGNVALECELCETANTRRMAVSRSNCGVKDIALLHWTPLVEPLVIRVGNEYVCFKTDSPVPHIRHEEEGHSRFKKLRRQVRAVSYSGGDVSKANKLRFGANGRCRLKHICEDCLRESIEFGEGIAAFGPQRFCPVQHVRDPPLLRQWGKRNLHCAEFRPTDFGHTPRGTCRHTREESAASKAIDVTPHESCSR